MFNKKVLFIFLIFCLNWSVANALSKKDAAAVASLSKGAMETGSNYGLFGYVFGGSYEIGTKIGCLLVKDPPDTLNACTPVNLDQYTSYHIPDVLTIDPSTNLNVAASIDAAMDDLDKVVALSRAFRATKDRYQGALILEREDCAADRFKELGILNGKLKQAGKQSRSSLEAYINVQNQQDPSVLKQIITKQSLKEIRDELATGSFPEADDIAISAWELTPFESESFKDTFSDLQDSDIEEIFAEWDPQEEGITFEFVLNYTAANICEECFDPDSPLLITLNSFEGFVEENSVRLTWRSVEQNNVGFHIWRGVENSNGDYINITALREFSHIERVEPDSNENCSTKIRGQLEANNSSQLPKLISAIGNSIESTCYSFTDTSNLSDGTYYYLLEDIDDNGNSTFHCDQIDAVTVGQGPAIDLESAINYCKEVTGSNN